MSASRSLLWATSASRRTCPLAYSAGPSVRLVSSSTPFNPPPPGEAAPRVNRPPLRSLAQIKADKAVEQHRLDTLRGAGWIKSTEPGEEDQEERVVYSRPVGQSSVLIWGFLASQIIFLASLVDMQAGTTFILPAPLSPPPSPAVKTVSSPNTLPDDPPTFQPEAYKPGSRITPTYNIPHPDPEAAAAEAAYKPPYLAWFALTVVCVGLPVGLFQGWAKSSIVKITSLRPSGRIKVFTTKDKLLRWVRKEGYVADTGVASEAFQPDGAKKSPFVTLYLPVNGKTLKSKIDLSTPTERELAVAEARGQKVIVDRDLIRQTFEGIQEAS